MDVDWDALRALPVPTTLRLADGTDVPHEVGTRVYNFYDGEVGTIVGLATRPQPDTSGQLPDGAAWWVDVLPDCRRGEGRSNLTTLLDGSRMCSIEHARKRGWL